MRNPKKHKTSIILKLIIFTLCLVPLILFPDRNTDFGKKLFFKWDLSQNKKLEIDELPKHARKNFQKVDVNNDGSISLNEHLVFLTKNNNSRNNSNFRIIQDIPYAGTKNPRQTLDLFIPQEINKKDNLPLVIWIHGGGWKKGTKKSGHLPHRLPSIVETGKYIGACIGYRLSGEAIWPAQIHDCKAAIRWLYGNANKYRIDTNKIAVWGSSAGGHLASMLGVTNKKSEFDGALGNHLDQPCTIHTVLNYYGPSDLLTMNDYPSKIDHNAHDSPESQLLGFPIQEKKNLTKKASPISYTHKIHASFIHFHGTNDLLVPYPQSKIFHQTLKNAGVNSILITLKNGGHSMPDNFTQKYVLPYLDFTLLGIGELPEDKTILSN